MNVKLSHRAACWATVFSLAVGIAGCLQRDDLRAGSITTESNGDGGKNTEGSTTMSNQASSEAAAAAKSDFPGKKTDAELKKSLTPEQYCVMCENGTERPFKNKYWNTKVAGMYRCAACGHPLFSSDTKYDSGSGWPSYWKPISDKSVVTEEDRSSLMIRTEVLCANCGAHLGHVFNDGPAPTGLRYCMNSVAMKLEPAKPAKKPAARKAAKRDGSAIEHGIKTANERK